MDSNNSKTDWREPCRGLQNKLEYVFTQSVLTDLTVKVIFNGITEFKVHSFILKISSEVFEKMLSVNFKEGVNQTIEIKDIEPVTFRRLLRRMYGLNVNLLNLEGAFDLFTVADKYLVAEAKEFCLDYIKKNLNSSTVVECYDFAEKMNLFELKQCFSEVLQKDTRKIVEDESFLEASIPFVQCLLEQDMLSIKEIDLFKAFERWIQSIMSKNCGQLMNPIIIKELLTKFSFLNMTLQEFSNGPGRFQLLGFEEKFAFITKLSIPNNNEPLPHGFRCTKRKIREINITTKDLQVHQYNVDSTIVHIKVNETIDFTAVKIFTLRGCSTYIENISVLLSKNSDIKCETYFRGRVEHNSTIRMRFEKPFSLEPETVYKLQIQGTEGNRQCFNLLASKEILESDDLSLYLERHPSYNYLPIESFSFSY